MNALHHVITVLPSTSMLDAAALAAERKGILQTNGKVALIAPTLLRGYAKCVGAGKKKAA
jgi:hypothetical protein